MCSYFVIQKSPEPREYILKEWGPILARLIGTEESLPKPCEGDAFVIRDSLFEAGFTWGRDFYIRKQKVNEPENRE